MQNCGIQLLDIVQAFAYRHSLLSIMLDNIFFSDFQANKFLLDVILNKSAQQSLDLVVHTSIMKSLLQLQSDYCCSQHNELLVTLVFLTN